MASQSPKIAVPKTAVPKTAVPKTAAPKTAAPKTAVPKTAVPKTAAPKTAALRIGFLSLGCPKALVDSERIITRLRGEGYELSASYDGADAVVVNACGQAGLRPGDRLNVLVEDAGLYDLFARPVGPRAEPTRQPREVAR